MKCGLWPLGPSSLDISQKELRFNTSLNGGEKALSAHVTHISKRIWTHVNIRRHGNFENVHTGHAHSQVAHCMVFCYFFSFFAMCCFCFCFLVYFCVNGSRQRQERLNFPNSFSNWTGGIYNQLNFKEASNVSEWTFDGNFRKPDILCVGSLIEKNTRFACANSITRKNSFFWKFM